MGYFVEAIHYFSQKNFHKNLRENPRGFLFLSPDKKIETRTYIKSHMEYHLVYHHYYYHYHYYYCHPIIFMVEYVGIFCGRGNFVCYQ